MEFNSSASRVLRQKNASHKIFNLLAVLLVLSAIFLVLAVLFPAFVSTFFNVLWIVLLFAVIIFFALGLLVIMGMKSEASRILDVLLEGSLTILDFIEFIKEVWYSFLQLLRDFILYITPVFAGVFAFLIYILLIVVYKSVGRSFDVTMMTVLLSMLMVICIGLFNRARNGVEILGWTAEVKKKFQSAFTDAFEVLTFVFFITFDMERLFFLPESLNVPIRAAVGEYDLMVRSFAFNDHFKITTILIVVAISVEILRFMLRVSALAVNHYRRDLTMRSYESNATRISMIKSAIRQSFADSKDDTIKFITFTTILFLVFLAFPRLKLIALGAASITGLLMDLAVPGRLTITKQNDLISRILAKAFKV